VGLHEDGGKLVIVSVPMNVGATTLYPLLYATKNYVLNRVIFLPWSDIAADGTDYWTLMLVRYEETGAIGVSIPIDERTGTFSTSARSLAIGRAVILPQVGYIEEMLTKDTSLYLKATKSASAADLKVMIQLHLSGR
jgi:hypothetical protein